MTAKEFLQIKSWYEINGKYTEQDVIELMQEYARIKCLEAIKNTRHKSIEIVGEYYSKKETGEGECALIQRDIQNIPNQDVMPEL